MLYFNLGLAQYPAYKHYNVQVADKDRNPPLVHSVLFLLKAAGDLLHVHNTLSGIHDITKYCI